MSVFEPVVDVADVGAERPQSSWMVDFEQLYRSEFVAITGYFARRSSDPHLVADLTSDTFYQAMVSFRSFDPRKGTPRAWLFGVARHVYANRTAGTIRHLDAARRAGGQRPLDCDEIDELVARIDAERASREFLASLKEMPPQERSAVELVDLAGLTPKEAANVVGVSPGAFRVRLFRARARLKKKG